MERISHHNHIKTTEWDAKLNEQRYKIRQEGGNNKGQCEQQMNNDFLFQN